MSALQSIIGAARTVRSEHEIRPQDEVPLTLRSDDPHQQALLRREIVAIRTLVKTAGEPTIEPRGAARPRGAVMTIAADTEVLVSLRGLVDPAKEGARVERELKKAEKDIAALEKKLALPSFADKAPPEVVAETKSQLEELRRKKAGLEEARGLASELTDEDEKKKP
jgi:valyl-tRNA synthetase